MSALTLGILISGRGSNMHAIADAIDQGTLDTSIGIVVSNNPEARGLDRARERGLPFTIVNRRDGRTRIERHRDILKALSLAKVDLVVCAGFDEILIAEITTAFADRIVNIHPSLLPAFGGGMHATQDALNYGAKVTGCTVHFVTADLDNGPILLQRTVDIREEDTEESLAARVLEQEHQALPEAIRLIAAGRVSINGRRVRIAPAPVSAVR
ncbi:MAG: phosphoribosylglycinamide formyltransferase [Chloroflexota bacterium]